MKRQRHGFTLIELLVVITIIGMLVGLLLPAIQMAREAARRGVCSSNLKQLTTALTGHSQKLGYFPSGGWGSNCVGIPDLGVGPGQPGGWIYQILPYMDQSTMYEMGRGGNSAKTALMISTPVSALYCPTRRGAQAYPFSQGTPLGSGPVTMAARTDYAINGGQIRIPSGPGPSSLTAGATTSSVPPNFNGIATAYSKVTEAMIPDSKDTTYLVCEKYVSPENYSIGVDMTPPQNDPGDLYSAVSGDDVSTIRWTGTPTSPLLPSMDRLANNNPPTTPSMIFGSAHGAGWFAGFCDWHVQLIGWNIDATLHTSMGSRNGHEVVDGSLIP